MYNRSSKDAAPGPGRILPKTRRCRASCSRHLASRLTIQCKHCADCVECGCSLTHTRGSCSVEQTARGGGNHLIDGKEPLVLALAGADNNDRRALFRDSIAHVLRSMKDHSSHGGMMCTNKDSEDWEVRSGCRITSWLDQNRDIHIGRTYMLSVTPILRPERY